MLEFLLNNPAFLVPITSILTTILTVGATLFVQTFIQKRAVRGQEKYKANISYDNLVISKTFDCLVKVSDFDSIVAVGDVIKFDGHEIPSDEVNRLLYSFGLRRKCYELISKLSGERNDSIELSLYDFEQVNKRFRIAMVENRDVPPGVIEGMLNSAGKAKSEIDNYLSDVIKKYTNRYK